MICWPSILKKFWELGIIDAEEIVNSLPVIDNICSALIAIVLTVALANCGSISIILSLVVVIEFKNTVKSKPSIFIKLAIPNTRPSCSKQY